MQGTGLCTQLNCHYIDKITFATLPTSIQIQNKQNNDMNKNQYNWQLF